MAAAIDAVKGGESVLRAAIKTIRCTTTDS